MAMTGVKMVLVVFGIPARSSALPILHSFPPSLYLSDSPGCLLLFPFGLVLLVPVEVEGETRAKSPLDARQKNGNEKGVVIHHPPAPSRQHPSTVTVHSKPRTRTEN